MSIIQNPLNIIEGMPDSRFNTAGDLLRLTGDLDPTGQSGKVIGIGPGDVAVLVNAGSAGVTQYAFSYGDASPALIVTIPAGKIVYGVSINISVPFDGIGASLQIGDAGVADRLMTASQNEPSTVGAYSTSPSYLYGTATQLNLSITPGAGATQGSGLIILSIQT